MAKTALEERLEAITREFVQQIVATIRSASFADVAGYGSSVGAPSARPSAAPAKPTSTKPVTRVVASPKRGTAERQTADRRAEIGEQVLATLKATGEPLSARQLSSQMGVPVDLLTQPLLELRAAGRVQKHGEKRATTYTPS